MAKDKKSTGNARMDAGLLEEDFEYQPREDVHEGMDLESQQAALADEHAAGAQNPTGVILSAPSSKQNPYVSQEEQGMELTPKTFGPPQYGSPDPATAAGRLLTLEDGHPLDTLPEGHPAEISSDYAADVLGASDDAGQDHPGEPTGAEEEVDATDAARELADSEGVNLSEVEGSGENGRVTKGDVEDFIAKRDESNES